MVSKAVPKKASIPPAAVVIVLVLLVGLAGFLYLDRTSKKEPPPPPPLSQEARAYARNLHLANVEMKAHSYSKQSVVEITGDIQNAGDRTVKLIEITCVFYDAYGQGGLAGACADRQSKLGAAAPARHARSACRSTMCLKGIR